MEKLACISFFLASTNSMITRRHMPLHSTSTRRGDKKEEKLRALLPHSAATWAQKQLG